MGKSHWNSIIVAVGCFSMAMGLSALAGPARPILLRALRQQTDDFKCDIKIKPVDAPEKFSPTETFSMTFRVTETGAPNCLPATVIVNSNLQLGTPPAITSSRIVTGQALTEPGSGNVNLQSRFSEAYLYEIKTKGTRRATVNGADVIVPYDLSNPVPRELLIEITASDGAAKQDRKIVRAKPENKK